MRWPHVPDEKVKPSALQPAANLPVVQRLTQDVAKRQRDFEQQQRVDYVFRDNQVVKKDVYIEYDFGLTLRSSLPGDKQARQSLISPAKQRQALVEEEYRKTSP